MACCDNLQLYFYNWMVYLSMQMAQVGCFNLGAWGLFFDDDDGIMMNKCYESYGGYMAAFPYYYLSIVSTDHPDN